LDKEYKTWLLDDEARLYRYWCKVVHFEKPKALATLLISTFVGKGDR
jgi:hypothetical protein